MATKTEIFRAPKREWQGRKQEPMKRRRDRDPRDQTESPETVNVGHARRLSVGLRASTCLRAGLNSHKGMITQFCTDMLPDYQWIWGLREEFPHVPAQKSSTCVSPLGSALSPPETRCWDATPELFLTAFQSQRATVTRAEFTHKTKA